MESKKQSSLPEMFGPWIYLSVEPPFKPRYRFTDVLTFAASGMVAGLAVTNLLYHVVTPAHASLGASILIGLISIGQIIYFSREMRRMKAMHEEIKASAVKLEKFTVTEADSTKHVM